MDDNEVRCQRPITPAYFGIEVSHTPYLVCKFSSFCQELISTVVISRYSISLLQSTIRTTTKGLPSGYQRRPIGADSGHLLISSCPIGRRT